ncbi:MAG: hypothetical protein OXG82_10500 [Gammaproteobacteria bacterium]|nr:hypothetical protein [Gammaproteobacteria bacterium]
MRETIVDNLTKRIGFYDDLIEQVGDSTLAAELAVPHSRSLGLHLWCIVGTRESYVKAIAAGEMSGWSSSVEKLEQDELRDKLARSGRDLLDAINAVSDWTPERDKLLAEVAEHEVMHEGQIIRLMCGLEKPLPSSCPWAVCG